MKNLEQSLNNIVKYFTMIKDVSRFRRSEFLSPSGISIDFNQITHDGSKNSYSFSVHEPTQEIRLRFSTQEVLRKESLADPRSAYLTTSASLVKRKTYKIDRFVKTEEKAIQTINKFLKI